MTLNEQLDKLREVKSEIDSLITFANETTGNEDTRLGDAVKSLADGYGQGGGDDDLGTSIIEGTVTEIRNDKVTNVRGYGFSGCSKLTSVDLPKVTSIGSYAFQNCNKLTSVNLPLVTSIDTYVFSKCSNLTSVNLPSVTSIGGSAFTNCIWLTSVDLPKVTSIGSNVFYYCSNLTSADFSLITSIGSGAFNSCTELTKLILRNTSEVCTYSNTTSSYDPKNENLKIYVPRALLEQYKVATNWSRLADKFVALEDYTVDGTTTGELIE